MPEARLALGDVRVADTGIRVNVVRARCTRWRLRHVEVEHVLSLVRPLLDNAGDRGIVEEPHLSHIAQAYIRACRSR